MNSWLKVVGVGGIALVVGLVIAAPAAGTGSQAAATPAPKGLVAQPFDAPVFQTSSELAYVPIAPCRIADTRNGGGPIDGGGTRTFHVTGSTGFAPAGGKSGGCGIPTGATAAAISVTGTASTASGYLTLFADGTIRPGVSQVSFTKGQNVSTPVTAALGSSSGSVNVYSSSRTQVLLDVSGYYVKPLAGFISPSGTPYAGSSRILSATRVTDPGVYEVMFDRDVRYCSSVASAYYYGYYATTDSYGTTSDHAVRVRLFNAAGAAVNGYFSVTVTC